MSSKFFTNQGNNTLVNKINHTLTTDKNIKSLDFLVGYVRLSGLKSIIDNMENYNSRILVGLKSDEYIYQATTQEIFAKTQIQNLQNNYHLVKKIEDMIVDKKLTIKITKEKNVHAKLYIFSDDGKLDHTSNNIEYNGSVIVGSSNLTHNGLEKSFELNTEIKDKYYIKDAIEIFDNLWKEAQELTSNDIEKYIKPYIKKPKPEYPNNLFYQVLIEYFDDIIDNNIDIKDTDITLFNYQKDAVNSAIIKLNRYNGAILGDVVGLGKTIIAVAILKIVKFKSLIISPPAIHSQWEETLSKFNISKNDYELVSFDKLPDNSDAQFVIIDESHKLKNSKSKKYEKIEELCKFPFRKKVLLLSATLQNNSPVDIANQIYLFQDRNNSNLPNIVSLEKFFAPHIKTYKNLKDEKDTQIVKMSLQNISNSIKHNILRPLLIRRTRTDIESFDMYKNDIDKFPKISKLQPLNYELNELNDSFVDTINILENHLQYSRFSVLNNINENAKNKYKSLKPYISDNIFKDNDLSTLAKYSFIKRFESSIQAFKISINNSIVTLEQFIIDLKNDRLYVGENSNHILNRQTSSKEYIYENGKIHYIKKTKNKLEKIYLKGIIFTKDDFKDINKFQDSLKKDLNYLKDLQNIWKDNKLDPKVDKFLEVINNFKDKKIVVFSEYSDTIEYLKKYFESKNIQKTLFITSSNRNQYSKTIAQNFDANYQTQANDYNIIITTDTLAEGINLHRSDTLINYDIPWNSTKLMQRMGRINRIGSDFDKLSIFNFKPIDKSNEIIGINEKSFLKLQSFHYTLGEDSKILFDDESVESFGIEEDSDEELKYLQLIRDFKELNLKLFNEIKSQKISSSHIKADNPIELNFFKIGKISHFYQKNGSYECIDFLTFIKHIEKYSKIDNLDNTKSNIDECINFYVMDKNTKEFTNNDLKNSFTKKDKEAIRILKEWYKKDIITKDIFLNTKNLLEAKSISTFVSMILSLQNKTNKDIFDKLNELSKTSYENIIDTKKIDTKIYIKIEAKDD